MTRGLLLASLAAGTLAAPAPASAAVAPAHSVFHRVPTRAVAPAYGAEPAIRAITVRPAEPVVGAHGSVRLVIDVVAKGARGKNGVTVKVEPGPPPGPLLASKPPLPAEPPIARTPGRPPVIRTPVRPPSPRTPDQPPSSRTPDQPPSVRSPAEPPSVRTPEEPPAVRAPEEPPAARNPQEPPSARTPDQPPPVRTPEQPPSEQPPSGYIPGQQPPGTTGPGTGPAAPGASSPGAFSPDGAAPAGPPSAYAPAVQPATAGASANVSATPQAGERPALPQRLAWRRAAPSTPRPEAGTSGGWETWRFLPDKKLSRYYPTGTWTVTATARGRDGRTVTEYAAFQFRRATRLSPVHTDQAKSGDGVRVRGTLTRVDPRGLTDYGPFGRQRLEILWRPDESAAWEPVGEAVTDAAGAYVSTITGRTKGYWRVRYPGTGHYASDATKSRQIAQ
ncbi:hypothetical protein MF672_022125 [Actinomadura sp. ATCC 31491]|uniref:Uncharacterized protein n=1 Tax=Actinomadura luzonensis TaxID=2805427 RepID=A0ABT0FW54_9ACTN|nr:hypothetical protein [Actinomadura luzonensis]MCK2216479.1 hypothetical protein [Actinomadura luzonensis]